ncbi:MAG: amidohydrolase family protein, partial [Candidatus Cloacimonetes bacterium]|nr:amidohydrolase family protein [Candidatus Cloacimonadota bacterium]
IFSGCTVVQDHAPNQKSEYYNQFPILVTPDYRQCHSISLGNWWGGRSASEEWQSTKGKMPFILHLAEGVNDSAKSAFGKLEAAGLLQPNTLIIHGIALTRAEIRKCAAAGTSICCCPESNIFLIGKTIDVQDCLEFGVNLVIGTDSTMSGSTNMLTEIKIFHENFPDIPMKQVFRFVTVNAGKALMLPKKYGELSEKTSELLLLDKIDEDPYENLLLCGMNEIRLLLHEGKPIYGDVEVLEYFKYNPDEYEFFRTGNREKFVIGHPQQVNRDIDSLLGYHKDFPYLPF